MSESLLYVVKYHDVPENVQTSSLTKQSIDWRGKYRGRGAVPTDDLQKAEIFGWSSWRVDKFRKNPHCDVIPIKIMETT